MALRIALRQNCDLWRIARQSEAAQGYRFRKLKAFVSQSVPPKLVLQRVCSGLTKTLRWVPQFVFHSRCGPALLHPSANFPSIVLRICFHIANKCLRSCCTVALNLLCNSFQFGFILRWYRTEKYTVHYPCRSIFDLVLLPFCVDFT